MLINRLVPIESIKNAANAAFFNTVVNVGSVVLVQCACFIKLKHGCQYFGCSPRCEQSKYQQTAQ